MGLSSEIVCRSRGELVGGRVDIRVNLLIVIPVSSFKFDPTILLVNCFGPRTS